MLTLATLLCSFFRIAKLSNTSQEVVKAKNELNIFLEEQNTDVKSLMKELDPQGFVGVSTSSERRMSVHGRASSPRYVAHVTP